jgi:membrane fusion protein, multidrug efflux system
LPNAEDHVRIALAFVAALALACGVALYAGVLPARIVADQYTAVRQFIAPAAPAPASAVSAPVPVVVAAVRLEDVPIFLSGIGTVQAYNAVNVKTQVDGTIMQILFTEGQDVQQGTPLALIDPRPLRAQLEQQQANLIKDQALLDGAVLDLNRYANLVLKDFASRQQLDQQQALVGQYRAQISNDNAQIDYAQTQLGYTTLRSPIAGRVGIRQVDQGNFLHAADGTTIVTITQLQPISVIFTLPANAVAQSRLHPGQVHVPVLAYGADDATRLDEGTIDLVDNTVDQTTGTIKLKASFPNKDIRLWPGNFVNGRLIVDTRRGATTIPEAALRHGPIGDFVWIVRPDKTVEFRAVRAGQAADGRVLIAAGLKRDELVVTEGQFRLVNGAHVEITRTEPGPLRPVAASAG